MLNDEKNEEKIAFELNKKMSKLHQVIEYLMYHLEERIMACEYLHQKGQQKVDNLLNETSEKLRIMQDEIDSAFLNCPQELKDAYESDYKDLKDDFEHTRKKYLGRIGKVVVTSAELRQQIYDYSQTLFPEIRKVVAFFNQKLDLNPDAHDEEIRQLRIEHNKKLRLHDMESRRTYEAFKKQSQIDEEHIILDYKRKISNVSVFQHLTTKQKNKTVRWMKIKKHQFAALRFKLQTARESIEQIMRKYEAMMNYYKGEGSILMRQMLIEYKKGEEKSENDKEEYKVDDTQMNTLKEERRSRLSNFEYKEKRENKDFDEIREVQNREIDQWHKEHDNEYDYIIEDAQKLINDEQQKLDAKLKQEEQEELKRLKEKMNHNEEFRNQKVSNDELIRAKEEHEKRKELKIKEFEREIEDCKENHIKDLNSLNNELQIAKTIKKQVLSTMETKSHLEKELEIIKEIQRENVEKMMKIPRDLAFEAEYEQLDDQLNSNMESMQDEMDSQIQDVKDEFDKKYAAQTKKYEDDIVKKKNELNQRYTTNKERDDLVAKYKYQLSRLNNEYEGLKTDEDYEIEKLEKLIAQKEKLEKETIPQKRETFISRYKEDFQPYEEENDIIQTHENNMRILTNYYQELENIHKQKNKEIKQNDEEKKNNETTEENNEGNNELDIEIERLKNELDKVKQESEKIIEEKQNELAKLQNENQIFENIYQEFISSTEVKNNSNNESTNEDNNETKQNDEEEKNNQDKESFNEDEKEKFLQILRNQKLLETFIENQQKIEQLRQEINIKRKDSDKTNIEETKPKESENYIQYKFLCDFEDAEKEQIQMVRELSKSLDAMKEELNTEREKLEQKKQEDSKIEAQINDLKKELSNKRKELRTLREELKKAESEAMDEGDIFASPPPIYPKPLSLIDSAKRPQTSLSARPKFITPNISK